MRNHQPYCSKVDVTVGLTLCLWRGLCRLALGLIVTHASWAQATYTATRNAGVSVFAGVSVVSPDYAKAPLDIGLSLGGDLSGYFHFPIVPSLETRVTLTEGPGVNEYTYLFGGRGQLILIPRTPRLHPYADLLVGLGDIRFHPVENGYSSDNSRVYSYGGGLDCDLLSNLQAKVDLQKQHWNTGEIGFTPTAFTLGMVYRFGFRSQGQP